MHRAFDRGWIYRLCPFMLLSHAPGRRLGRGCKSRHSVQGTAKRKPPGKPHSCTQFVSQSVAIVTAAIHRTVLSGHPFLAACWALQSPFLWPISGVWRQPKRQGRLLARYFVLSVPCCAFPGQLCSPWLCRDTLVGLLWYHSFEPHVHPHAVTHTTQDSRWLNYLIVFITNGAKLRYYRALESLKVFCLLVCVCVTYARIQGLVLILLK